VLDVFSTADEDALHFVLQQLAADPSPDGPLQVAQVI
jgi:hypothetical protein